MPRCPVLPLLLVVAACAAGDDQVDSAAPVVDATPHLAFLAVDNALGAVSRVDTRGTGTWTTSLGVGGPRDLSLADDDTVLVSTAVGAMWLALADGSVEAELTGYSDVQTARPLAGGGVLLGATDGDDAVFTEVDGEGAVVGAPLRLSGHTDLRLVRVLEDGNLLFTGGADGWRVFEVDRAGAEVWSAALPGKGYLAERLADGTTLATTGEDVEVVALGTDGAVVHTWGGRAADPELADAAFFSGFSIIDAEHVAVANWHGHDYSQGGPHMIVYGADGARVWSWTSDALVLCTNVLVLEAVGVEALRE